MEIIRYAINAAFVSCIVVGIVCSFIGVRDDERIRQAKRRELANMKRSARRMDQATAERIALNKRYASLLESAEGAPAWPFQKFRIPRQDAGVTTQEPSKQEEPNSDQAE